MGQIRAAALRALGGSGRDEARTVLDQLLAATGRVMAGIKTGKNHQASRQRARTSQIMTVLSASHREESFV